MTIAIRESTWDGLNPTQKAAVRWTLARLQIGQPAIYVNGSGVRQRVHDDPRIDLDDLAVLGCVAANLNLLASQQNLPEGDQLRQQVRDFVASRVAWPRDIAGLQDSADPWQAVLTAQGAPASVKAGSGIPAGWSPV